MPASDVELLAPAGEPRALRAALAAGADAVYFGLESWSARAFAGNFAAEQVAAAIDLAHLYDAHAYLALNTLLKEDEVAPALAALEAPYLAGLDALIVADLGFAGRVRAAYPDLPLHASTQAGTHSSSQLEALMRLGFRRAILARELSLTEIAALETHGVELEVFVHGALCYGYSGDCLLSSMVGGRSGNRGRCSQPCRLRYQLRRAGEPAATPASLPGGGSVDAAAQDAATRIMSTSDLAALGALPQLLAAGVTSFKVEGRMKDAAYVGTATAVYREALDAARADPAAYEVRSQWKARLEQSFSRSFTAAHLEGRHHEVRSGGRGSNRGVLVGRVSRVNEARGEVVVRLAQPVAAGDLVYLYTPWGQSEPVRVEEGGDDVLTLYLHERVAVKDRLFRLAAADADELARDLVAGRAALRPVMLRMSLKGEEGRPAALTVEVAGAHVFVATVTSATPLQPARTAALTAEKARAALGSLGGTPYRLGELEFGVADGLFIGVGDLKDLRRRAVAELDECRLSARRRAGASVAAAGAAARPVATAAAPPPSSAPPPVASPRLQPAETGSPGADRRSGSAAGVVLVLRLGERPLPAPGVTGVALDLLVSDLPSAIGDALASLSAEGLPVRCRLPEVLFDADRRWAQEVLALPWDAVQVRHLGMLGMQTAPSAGGPSAVAPAAVGPPAVARAAAGPSAAGPAIVLEYPLQGLNSLTAGVAMELAGRAPRAVVASPEMSLPEIAVLCEKLAAGEAFLDVPPAVEALAFGRQQVLHARDQLGRAEGLYGPLGPAAHVGLTLEDTKGYGFPVDVDATGTRVFNARVTNLTPNLDELRDAGVEAFLVVQSDMSAAERAAFAAEGLSGLAAHAARERSTTGHLFRGVA